MATNKLSQLVLKLIKDTDAGILEWQPTVDEDETFQVVFPSYTIKIWQHRSDTIVGIYNERGILIESVSSQLLDSEETPIDTPNFRIGMDSMYSKARRVALGADGAIDSLLSELEKLERK